MAARYSRMRRGIPSDRTSAFLIVAAGAIATATITAVCIVSGAAFPDPDPGLLPASIPFTSTVRTAEALAIHATRQLLTLLAIIGWGTLIVGLVAVLALWADHAARVRGDIAVHRAVGASRRTLLGGALTEGLRLAIPAIILGLGLGLVASWLVGQPWAASWDGVGSALGPAVATVLLTIVLGACFPNWSLGSRRVVEADEAPSPLGFASAQLAVSLSLLVAGAIVIRQTRTLTSPERANGPDPTSLIHRVVSDGASPLDLAGLVDQSGAGGPPLSLTQPWGHLGLGAVDELVTECGQCFVGGIFLRFRPLRATYLTASADTFQATSLTLVEGRGFTNQDRIGAPPVAVVNTYLARRYFENGQPGGRAIFLGGNFGGPRYLVVGVVDDRRPIGVGGGEQPLETIYLSSLQHPGPTAEALAPPGTALKVPGGMRIVATETGADLVRRAITPLRWFGGWFVATGLIALLLAMSGTAALMMIWVHSLRSELALRRAVGARQRDVVAVILGGSIRTGLTGLAVAVTTFGPMLWPNLDLVVPGALLAARFARPRGASDGCCRLARLGRPDRPLAPGHPHRNVVEPVTDVRRFAVPFDPATSPAAPKPESQCRLSRRFESPIRSITGRERNLAQGRVLAAPRPSNCDG